MLLGTGKLNFDAFEEIASHFLEDEDAEAMQQELKEAFRLYDREGESSFATYCFPYLAFRCCKSIKVMQTVQ